MNETFAISGYTSSDKIWCYIAGDEIYQTDFYGQKKLIGRTVAAYNELEETTAEYYAKLVDLGVIVPPKSQEELMGEMQRTMADMTGIIAALSAEVKELKENGNKHCTCHAGEDVPGRKSAGRSSKSTASDSGDAG